MAVDYYLNEFEALDYLQKRGVTFSLAWLRKCRSNKTGIPYVKIAGKVLYMRQGIDSWLLSQADRHHQQPYDGTKFRI